MPITTHENEILVPLETKVWRYMDKSKFESLLRDKALFFCRADKFADPFEGSLPVKEATYRNDYRKRLGGNLPEEVCRIQESNIKGLESLHQRFKRATVVNCWHMNNTESDAMWQLYLKDNEGIAISTTVLQLYKSLERTEQEVGSSRVRYLNYEEDIWHHPEEYPHTGYNLLTPFVHKRREFIHENEFRLYHQIQEAVDDDTFWSKQLNHKGILIPVEVGSLVQDIILAPTADEEVKNQIENLILAYGYSFSIRKSALQSAPIY